MQKTTSNDDIKYSDLKEMYDQTNNTIEEFLNHKPLLKQNLTNQSYVQELLKISA
jgi:hypothetical protein